MDIESLKNNILVFDIETYSQDQNGKEISIRTDFDRYVELAECKWFGAYSYKDNKEYYLEVSKNKEKIKDILENHTVLVGFNSENFDYPIIVKNGLVNEMKRFNQIDLMKILGASRYKDKDGNKYKDRANLMGYKLKNNSLRHVAEKMELKVQKGDIDYKIFSKNKWTEEEEKEIIKYLKNDVMATKGMFDKLWDYWKPFTNLLDWKDIQKLSWIKSSIASLIYKSICYNLGIEATYSDKKGKKEKMGGNVFLPVYEEARDVWYIDFFSLYSHIFCMFNLFAETNNKDDWHGNGIFKVKGYYDISHKHPLTKVVEDKLKQRADIKKNDPENPMGYTLKIFNNALYGIVRSPVFEKVHKPTAGWDCCWLGQQLQDFVKEELHKKGFEAIAGDSVTGDTKINLESKDISIEEIWNKNKNKIIKKNNKEIKVWNSEKVLTCDTNIDNIFEYPTEIIRHKCDKKIYEIELTTQEKLKVTEDHGLIFLDNNFNYTTFSPKDILDKKNKFVLFNRKIPHKVISKNYDLELYNLMGMTIANGSLQRNTIELSFEYIDEYIKNVISKISIPHVIKRRQKKTDIRINGKEIVQLFFKEGFVETSKTKKVPKWLFNEKEENICEFLKGCMSGDGTVSIRSNSPIIRYTSINEQLIDDLQKLFQLVGIATSKIKEKRPNNYNGVCSGTYSCHLSVLDRQIYKEKIGFSCKEKQDRIKNYKFLQYINSKDKPIARSQGNYGFGFIPRHIKSIKEISYDGHVYDISIPNNEKFYANNVLVHNTDSLFVSCKHKKHKDRDFIKACIKKIIKKINDNVPFPSDTFNMDIECFIDYILFPFSKEPVVDEEIRKKLKNKMIEGYKEDEEDGKKIIIDTNSKKIVKKGRSWIKEWRGKKKNYFYLYTEDGETKVQIVGLPIKKDNATPLGMKIYEEVLKPKILENKRAKFTKEFIDNAIDTYLKKKEFLELIAVEYRVNPFDTYKIPKGKSEPTGIHAQISKGYFNGQEGTISLIKNNKIGKAGKSSKYCTIDEAIHEKLTVKDIDLEKIYNELQPFIKT